MNRTLVVTALVLAVEAAAQAPAKDGKVVKSARDEISRLQRELDQQRALLVRILEAQEKQYSMLVKLAKGQISEPQVVEPEPMPAAAVVPEPPPAPASAGPSPQPKASPKPSKGAGPTGTISGKVSFKGRAAPAWVFVQDLTGKSDGVLEIKQEDKQFIPRVAAVPRGTRLVFENADNIFHNVFSVSEGNAFDVGNTRSGEPPRSYVTQNPGVVDIFCNMHAKMSASVLIAPGVYLVKVQDDGTFRLEDVPVGQRKIGAWAGGPVVTKAVTLTTAGADLSFEVEPGSHGSHKNKHGQSYGSYAD